MRPKIVLLYLGDNLELMKKAPEIYEKIEQVKIDFDTGDVIDPCFIRLHADANPDLDWIEISMISALNNVLQDYGDINKIYFHTTDPEYLDLFIKATRTLNIDKYRLIYNDNGYVGSERISKAYHTLPNTPAHI